MRHSLTNNHEKIFKSFMIRRRILALQTDYSSVHESLIAVMLKSDFFSKIHFSRPFNEKYDNHWF